VVQQQHCRELRHALQMQGVQLLSLAAQSRSQKVQRVGEMSSFSGFKNGGGRTGRPRGGPPENSTGFDWVPGTQSGPAVSGGGPSS